MLLDYLNDPELEENYGWCLVAGLGCIQLMRNFSFGLNFNVGLHTGELINFLSS